MSGVGISPEVADVLSRSTIEDRLLRLPAGQLDRKLYAATNKVLAALGGRWDRRVGGHVFPFAVQPKLDEALGAGKAVSRQQKLQLFETPEALARRMVELADIEPHSSACLEPSAGPGRIVHGLMAAQPWQIVAVEIDADNVAALQASGAECWIEQADFLEWKIPGDYPMDQFDVIVMNPPFRANQDVRHVRRAFDLLAPGGRLVAIVSEHGFIGREREAVEWRQWLADQQAEINHVTPGTFRESGTNVPTRLIKIRKAAA